MEIRRFNEEDWRGFAGAERFSNGEDPWILDCIPAADDFPDSWWNVYQYSSELEERAVSIIVDKNGVEVTGLWGGMYWRPDPRPSGDPEEMEVRDQVGKFILYLFSTLKEVSYEKLIGIGFKEY